MKTDSLFYRLFQRAPALVFELAGLEAPAAGAYQYSRRGDQANHLSTGRAAGPTPGTARSAGGVGGSAGAAGPRLLRAVLRRIAVVPLPEPAAASVAGGGDLPDPCRGAAERPAFRLAVGLAGSPAGLSGSRAIALKVDNKLILSF